MTLARLLLRSLLYHARGHFAVAMGAAVSAAVLAGALLVGDSLRGSLRARTDRQLAGVDLALVPGRFFRSDLASELPGDIRPVILLTGTVRHGEQRAGRVNVIGADSRFGLGENSPSNESATVSTHLANALNVTAGDTIEVTIQKASSVPRASALARRDTSSATRSFKLRIQTVLPDRHPAGEFTLSPSPVTPLNLIVPLDVLQRESEQPARVNALLSPTQSAQSLQTELSKHLTLDDWGLKVTAPGPDVPYVSVESRRLLLEPSAVQAAQRAAADLDCLAAPTLTYLANTISGPGGEIPYSVVAGIDPSLPAGANPAGVAFNDDEIVLGDWADSPIKAKPGDSIQVRYFKPEVEGKIEELTATFKLKAIVPLRGKGAGPTLVPEFPGITDKLEVKNWDPPFPYDNRRIKPRDEKYWKEHRTTPKAYISLQTARRIWGSRFGDTTSVRLFPKNSDPAQIESAVKQAVLKNLDAEKSGFAFDPVRERLMNAGKGSTDFGLLFVAFSFFLILAALGLVGMLFRLNLERRSREIGLLLATGYSLRTARRLLVIEGAIVATIGSLFGLAGAVFYADGMLRVLISLWPTRSVGSFLELHVSAVSLVVGLIGSVVMSLIAMIWAIRGISRIEAARLLKGTTTDDSTAVDGSRWGPRLVFIGILFGITLLAIGPMMPAGEPRAGTFFGGGSFLLTAGLAAVWTWLKRPRRSTARSLNRLAIRNATRGPSRSLLTAGLLASASFLLVAVESFRREPDREFAQKNGGSGGLPILAETDSPVFFDPSSKDNEQVKEEISRLAQRWAQTSTANADLRDSRAAQAVTTVELATIFPFRVRAGDDASCLNLYQATRPRVLGAPHSLIERGGFRFNGSLAETAEEKENPWRLLERTSDVIPAFVEENTAMWQLKKGLGDTVTIPNEEGQPVTFKLVGFLKDSVFQSELVVSDEGFRKAFPRTDGYSYFLVEPPDGAGIGQTELAFENVFAPYGLEGTPTADRVASFLAVQNTYLSTFQLLGGFGLILGVLGLAVVLLRNVWERRGELALLRSIGYEPATLNRLVFTENATVLLMGLSVGVLSALVSVLPHVASGNSVPWARLALMLTGVSTVGLMAAAIAVVFAGRGPIVRGLRRE